MKICVLDTILLWLLVKFLFHVSCLYQAIVFRRYSRSILDLQVYVFLICKEKRGREYSSKLRWCFYLCGWVLFVGVCAWTVWWILFHPFIVLFQDVFMCEQEESLKRVEIHSFLNTTITNAIYITGRPHLPVHIAVNYADEDAPSSLEAHSSWGEDSGIIEVLSKFCLCWLNCVFTFLPASRISVPQAIGRVSCPLVTMECLP